MSERMKKHLRASWLIFTTTDDPQPADPAPADPAPSDPAPADPPAPSDDGGDPPADPGDGKTPLALDQIPESMRSLFEGIETQEDLAARLKAPEVPESYTLPEGLPEGAINEETFTEFQPLAKELGLTQDDVGKLITFQAGLAEKQSQQIYDRVLDLQAQGFKTELDTLKDTMGADKFNVAHQQAMKTVEAVAGEAVMKELQSTGLINSPLIFRFGQEIYQKLMKEDGPGLPQINIKDGIRQGDPNVASSFYGRMKKGEGPSNEK